MSTYRGGEGEHNLYVFERDAQFPAGRIAFVARLSAADLEAFERTVRLGTDVTPDGQFLVFASDRDLTADDTSTARQIFEYDADQTRLARCACRSGRAASTTTATSTTDVHVRAIEVLNDASSPRASRLDPGVQPCRPMARTCSFRASSASRRRRSIGRCSAHLEVNPQTHYRILPIYANNVYEYHDGRVSLISDGQDLTFCDVMSSVVQLVRHGRIRRRRVLQNGRSAGGAGHRRRMSTSTMRGSMAAFRLRRAGVLRGEACQGALSGAPTLLSPGSEFQAGGNPPLAALGVQPEGQADVADKYKKKKPTAGCVKAGGKRGKQSVKKRRAVMRIVDSCGVSHRGPALSAAGARPRSSARGVWPGVVGQAVAGPTVFTSEPAASP